MKKITFSKHSSGLSYFYKRIREVSNFQQEYFEKVQPPFKHSYHMITSWVIRVRSTNIQVGVIYLMEEEDVVLASHLKQKIKIKFA